MTIILPECIRSGYFYNSAS